MLTWLAVRGAAPTCADLYATMLTWPAVQGTAPADAYLYALMLRWTAVRGAALACAYLYAIMMTWPAVRGAVHRTVTSYLIGKCRYINAIKFSAKVIRVAYEHCRICSLTDT